MSDENLKQAVAKLEQALERLRKLSAQEAESRT
jgi:hypothetical protein